MKAQTAETPRKYPTPEQVTPVIIKFSGGGGGGSDADAEIAPEEATLSIQSDFMPFEDSTGGTWERAFSQFTGRIYELTLRDGGSPIFCSVTPRPDAVTSLEIEYSISDVGEVFAAREVPENGLFKLEVTSSKVPFSVTEGAGGAGWIESQAKYPGIPKRAVFKQTDIKTGVDYFKLEYKYNSKNPALSLDFRTDPLDQ